ncbi:hypothetical protein DRJ17_06800 [Candidatus Woesearchaeota archaeon]|nr:MAG: hypothetical protein DRJ17_06800 [Candidatus Woesearchaeota archaeon]
MRIGVVLSSGGSAFAQVSKMLANIPAKEHDFVVVTDRECGAEDFCIANHVKHQRIQWTNNKDFSVAAAKYFKESEVDYVILFFSRLVTAELYRTLPAFNVHPALLPAFKGINAVERAWKSDVRFFGTTLHLVDETVDGGAIVAQVIIPVLPEYTLEMMHKLSYIQKVYVFLLFIELIETGALIVSEDYLRIEIRRDLSCTDRSNPCLLDPQFLEAFMEFQRQEGLEVVI